ncbi:MAG: chemotaxis protein CheW [Bdellovibrionaceae bacterium]|nr:chemotaxis protein CheW [Bdellovibrionales bacterium]MCB9084006.1 chemotaxis protein CheW [Pseudobdellovibrionaceae bacterium]
MFDDLIGQYVVEGLENLEKWEEACLELGRGFNEESAKLLYRIAHNLKGGAQIFGLEELIRFCHRTEDLLRLVVNQELSVDPNLVAFLLDLETLLKDWLNQLNKDMAFVPALAEPKNRLEIFIDQSKSASVVKVSTEDSKGAESPTEGTPTEESSSSPELEDHLKEMLASGADPRMGHGGGSGRTGGGKPGAADSGEGKGDSTIRVSAQKLDELIQLIGELSLNQSIVNQSVNKGQMNTEVFENALGATNKIAKALQSAALDLRMQTLGGLFQKLRRTAWDVARQQDKEVEIEVVGDEVALDRTVIERVSEPLVHCIRNAVDHGIEDVGGRESKGKPNQALLRIQAVNEAGGVTISISDDGKGINPEAVMTKAVAKGLIDADTYLTDHEKMELIFLPGFSTAEQVTDISGRGIGMDIVKTAVDSLGGEIAIESEVDIGTTIRMNLPINLSIMDALVIEIGGLDYAIPTKDLSEVIDLSDYTIESTGKTQKMINIRGKVVPLNPLRRYLPSTIQARNQEDELKWEKFPALIYENEVGKFAFWVESVKQQQQVFVRPLADHLAKIPGVGGATILSNGEPSMIVSLPSIAKKMSSKVRPA